MEDLFNNTVAPAKLQAKSKHNPDLPINRLLSYGKGALNNKETLSILTGTPANVCEELLTYCGNNLKELQRLSIHDLIKIGKITQAQAARIIAAFELSTRKDLQDTLYRGKLSSSRDTFEALIDLQELQYEEFHILCLDRANRIIQRVKISEGGISGTVADPKKIFKIAIDLNSSSMILAHNHPSGNVSPSEADIGLTRKLKEAGLLLDMPVLDHLIIGGTNFYSFADEGLL